MVNYDQTVETIISKLPSKAALVQLMSDFAYKGFDPTAWFNNFMTYATDMNSLPDHIATMLVVYFVRGPNIDNLKVDNTSSTDLVKDFAKLKAMYHLKSKPGGEVLAVTLPRMAMVFAFVSFRIMENLDVTWPVSEAEILVAGSSKLYPNFVACLLNQTFVATPEGGWIYFVYLMYQCHLSFKTQVSKRNPNPPNKKKIYEFYTDSSNYAALALNGSLVSAANKMYAQEYFKGMGLENRNEKKLEAFKHFVAFGGFPSQVEELCSFQVLINRCIRDPNAIQTYTVADMGLSLADAIEKYGV